RRGRSRGGASRRRSHRGAGTAQRLRVADGRIGAEAWTGGPRALARADRRSPAHGRGGPTLVTHPEATMSDRIQPRVKCLLVDDRQETLLALSTLFRRDDVILLEARSGAAALDLLLDHEVALALLDVQMPEMDGFELAELMRGSERTRHVP